MNFQIDGVTLASPGIKAGGGLQYMTGVHTYTAIMNGAPTAVEFAIDGSLDGVHWSEIGSHIFSAGEITAGYASLFIVGKAVDHIRARAVVLTGGTTPSLDFLGRVL